MNNSWDKSYVFGRVGGGGPRVAHIVAGHLPYGAFLYAIKGLCDMKVDDLSPLSHPYPVCKPCLRAKRLMVAQP